MDQPFYDVILIIHGRRLYLLADRKAGAHLHIGSPIVRAQLALSSAANGSARAAIWRWIPVWAASPI